MTNEICELIVHDKSRFAYNYCYKMSCVIKESIEIFKNQLIERYENGKTISYPVEFKDLFEWIGVLDQMIEGFEIICSDDPDLWENGSDKIENAIKLYNKWFLNMWI